MQVVSTRPRIWLTPASLADLKQRAVPETSDRWNTLLNVVNRANGGWDTGIINFSLAYAITGNTVYGRQAIDLLLSSAKDGIAAISGDSGYQCRNAFPAAAICFDYCYPLLTAAEKVTLIAVMELWAAWTWPETNPDRKGAWAIEDPNNNYFYGFLLSGMLGYALAGDSPKAQSIIDLALTKWRTLVVPNLSTAVKGGVWAEGTSYGTMSTGFLLWYALAHLTATGEDLLAGLTWPQEAAQAMLHLTAPDMTRVAPLGDQAQNSGAALNDNHRRVMLLLNRVSPAAQIWLDQITPNRDLQRGAAWEEFLFAVSPTPAGTPRTSETFYCAPGAGVVSTRSGWSQSDTQIVFVCGSTTQSHQDRAQGAFYLFRSDWLTATAKLRTRSGLAQGCEDSNCLSVDGKPQAWTQDQAKLVAQEETTDYTYLRGDLTGAYAGQLTGYTRELFFLKTGYLLTRDTYSLVNLNSQVVYHLHALVNPGSVTSGACRAGGLFVQAVHPPSPLAAVLPFRQTPDQLVPTFRVDLTADTDNDLIVALEAGTPTQPARTLGATVTAPGLKGIQCGLAFVAWLTGPGPWSYVSSVPGTHYLLGLKPRTQYSVGRQTAVTSAAGILDFSGLSLSTPIIISEGAGPPPPPPPAITGMLDSTRQPITSAFDGTAALVTGSGFGTTPGSVRVAQLPATVTSWAPGEIAVILPRLPAQFGLERTGPLEVTAGGATALSAAIFTLRSSAPPPPPPPKSFTLSGTVTQADDGSLSGTLKLVPQP
jgi:hypothetical protein